jgi:glycosyltransferase involved in cell wall biosynthesis
MYWLKLTSLLKKASSSVRNVFSGESVYYVAEAADWVILYEGIKIQQYINKWQHKFAVTYSSKGIRNSVIHYGSEGLLFDAKKIKKPHNSNKVIVTCYHIKNNDPKFRFAVEADQLIHRWHTACRITKNKLIKLGILADKIDVIPLGIEPDKFYPWSEQKITSFKRRLGIDLKYSVIGYFQKDGVGWGEGNEPKLEKGPDVFCDVVEALAERHDIFVLLTGPARGYVKKRLSASNIPFMHHYLKDPHEVADYFRISDLCLVTSREEGGPKAILEAMACGVPVVSTRVGMAPDVIGNGTNGFLVDIEDLESLIQRATEILTSESLQRKLIVNGFHNISKYYYSNVTNGYIELYRNVMSSG